jgi:hypothetical protein
VIPVSIVIATLKIIADTVTFWVLFGGQNRLPTLQMGNAFLPTLHYNCGQNRISRPAFTACCYTE